MVRRKKRVHSRAVARRRGGRAKSVKAVSRRASRPSVRIRLRRSGAAGARRGSKVARPAATPESRASQRADALYQAAVKNFESGAKLFQKHHYDKALEIFEKLSAEAPAEVGSRAEAYKRMCEQRIRPSTPQAKGSGEYYDLGIAQLNARNLDAALESLTRAQKGSSDQEHIRYALAAVHALKGHSDAALEHLAAAIRLRPVNRTLAARDGDFAPLAHDPRFRQLILSGHLTH